jgi:PAS domain S-box-containing protein
MDLNGLHLGANGRKGDLQSGDRQAIAAPVLRSADAPINILIVDDEPKNLTVLETILDDPGYKLVRAESADQALLALLVEEFALLILDIRMPGVTGFELAQMIKQRKKTAPVPIIFLTAYYNEDQHVLEGYGTGAVDYLLKPVAPAVLRSKVSIFAELYRKQREVELANRALLDEVGSRRKAEEQLRELNNTLEQHVLERTASLRLSEERLRAIYDGTFEYMGLLSPDGTLQEANRSALEFAGSKLENVVGLPFWEGIWFQFTPGAPEVVRQAIVRAAAGEQVRFEMPITTPAGEAKTFDASFRPIRDEKGDVILIVPTALDITARKHAEEAVRESERRFREMLDALPAAVFTIDDQGFLTHFNPACIELSGRVPKPGSDQWCIGWKLYDEDGAPLPHNKCPMAIAFKEGRTISGAELIVERPDGSRIWATSYPTVLRNAEEQIVGAINILVNISERKFAEEHIRGLIKEVNHRSKNILSVVQAIARQTAAMSPEEFVPRFSERVRALAASHDLIFQRQWQGIEITELLRAHLALFEDPLDRRILIDGPPLRLSVAAAQLIGMVMHELATNASKYGALSNQVGSVKIGWGAERLEGRFTMIWVEHGGPPVFASARRGFGSSVIKSMAELSLDGQVELDFAPSGLIWRLSCPLAKVCDKVEMSE